MTKKTENIGTSGRTSDHKALKAPTLKQLNRNLKLRVPKELLNTLYERDIRRLADIRRSGGISHLENLPVAADHPVVRTLEAHAYLGLVSDNHKANKKLMNAGFHSIADIARTTRKSFVKKAKEAGIKEDVAFTMYAKATAQAAFFNNVFTGFRADRANNFDIPGPIEPFVDLPFPRECGCMECESAVSPLAYLADLLDYTITHVKHNDGSINLSFLESKFHQPFGRLPASCEEMEKQVRQVRICIEVLRSYLKTIRLTEEQKSDWAEAEAEYLLAAYNVLLNQIGTSYEEIRLISTMDEEKRKGLADRLSIHVDHLDNIFLNPETDSEQDSMTERNLEKIFGLTDTTRNPLSEGATLNDQRGQITCWNLNGLQWNRNTDSDGTIYVTLRKSSSVFLVELYRDRERRELVASGERSSAVGTVELWEKNDCGLTGSFDIAYRVRDNDIEISAISNFISWRLQHLRTLWKEQDWPADPYTNAEGGLPVIDPDVIGPDDFRTPVADNAFDIWIIRRRWVDEQIGELEAIVPDLESIISCMYETGTYGDTDVIPWENAPTPDNLDIIYKRLVQGIEEEEEEEEEVINTIEKDLHLTVESFTRLMEIRAKILAETEELTDEEWRELCSILVQAQKVSLFSTWCKEEQMNGVLFGPQQFWISLREPKDGDWPPVLSEGRPLIDPAVLELDDLPEPAVGRRAIALWQARRTRLDEIYETLKNKCEVEGFDAMLTHALGEPNPGDALPYDLAELKDKLNRADEVAREEVSTVIRNELYMTVEDFIHVMEIKAKNEAEDPESKPTELECAEIYEILTQAQKEKREFSDWCDEERDLEYWSALKARLPQWRATTEIRQMWQQVLRRRSSAPIIDPDIIVPSDLKDPIGGNPAYDILDKREKDTEKKFKELKRRIRDQEGFKTSWIEIVGAGWEEFEQLSQERSEGEGIEAKRERLSLTTAAFDRLVSLYEILETGNILDSEWDEAYSILVQVWKRRQFALWRDEERAKSIILSPDIFRIAKADEEPGELEQWRASREARRDWQDGLSARIGQKKAVIAALNQALDACEGAALALLRDALIMASDAEGSDITTKAKSLTDKLLIDCQIDVCQKTTRVAQAIVTLQTLFFSLRTGKFDDSGFVLDAENFDEEWEWIGSYETWKAAVFVFIYPENILLPSLRHRQTPAFKELIAKLRRDRRLTPDKARELAKEYEAYFKDICSLRLETAVRTTSPTRIYIIAKGGFTKSLYMSSYDPDDASDYTQTFWEKITELETVQVIDVVGAVPYRIDENRYIYLFLKIMIDGEEKLVFIKYNLDRGLWDPELTPLDLPEGVKTFSAVVKQRHGEDEPPMLAIMLGGNVYARRLNDQGSIWEGKKGEEEREEEGEWESFILCECPVIDEVLSFIELRRTPELVALVVKQIDHFDGSCITYLAYGIFGKEPNIWKQLHLSGGEEALGGFYLLCEGDIYIFKGAFPFPEENKPSFYALWGTTTSTICKVVDIDGSEIKEGPEFNLNENIRKIICCCQNPETNGHITNTEAIYEATASMYNEGGIFRCKLTKNENDKLETANECKLSLSQYIFLFGDLPEDIFSISLTDKFTDAMLEWKKYFIKYLVTINEDKVIVLTYLKEAFYFVPVAIALQLQRARQYTAALDWFRSVYDYTRPKNDRKIYYGLEHEEDKEYGYERENDWLLDPLNPHAVAETRRNTYTRFTLLSIIRCFLDYADAEFTRDTAESLPRARTLYETALELLELPELNQYLGLCTDIIGYLEMELRDSRWEGVWRGILNDMDGIDSVAVLESTVDELRTIMRDSRPLPVRLTEARKTANEALIERKSKTIGNIVDMRKRAVTDIHRFLLEDESIERSVELMTPPKTVYGVPATPEAEVRTRPPAVVGYIPTVSTFEFCIPPNPMIRALRLHVENSLHKLRTCRNIAGVKREIELYAAPVDVISGMPAIGAGGQLIVPTRITPPPVPYRYEFLIERTKQLINIATQVEAAFLSTLEKRDIEYYHLLKARQDIRLARAGVRLQDLRYHQAQDEVKLAELQRESAQIQAQAYQEWIEAGLNEYEMEVIDAYCEAAMARIGVATLEAFLQSGQALTTAASASLATLGGAMLNAVLVTVAASLRAREIYTAIEAETAAQVASIYATLERRKQEWQLQKDLAEHSIRIGDQQIRITEDGVRIVAQERNIAKMQVEHAESTVEFLDNKFTNVELYDWMSDVLEGVYSYFIQEATAMAKLAQNQLAFERQEPPPAVILDDYWEVPSENLLGGATEDAVDRHGLTGSARLMADIYRLDQYRLETEKRKLQLTKNISLARMCPYEFQLFKETGVIVFETSMELFDRDFPGHHLRMIKRVRTSVIALIPPTQGIKATFSNTGISRIVVNNNSLFQTITAHRPPESVALTSPSSATGYFELESRSEMLLPFEGLGVDTVWEFRMPKAANRFDYSTIADIIISIEYTALDSYDYRQQVIETLPSTISAERPFSFRHQFADQWYDLHNPEQTATPMCVRFRTRREDFPPNIENLKIEHVVLYFAEADGGLSEIETTLHFRPEGGMADIGGEATSIDSVISTRRGNAGSWTLMIGKSPVGEWVLALPNTEEMKNRFKNEEIENILFVVTYSGCTPEWPE